MDWIARISSQKESAGRVKKICKSIERDATKPTKSVETDKLNYAKPFVVNEELRIPLNCDSKYKWWAGGQSIFKTLLEFGASDEVVKNYIGPITSPGDWRSWQEIKSQDATDK